MAIQQYSNIYIFIYIYILSYCRVYIYYIYIWQYRNIAKRFRYGIRFCIEAFCVSLERAKVKGIWRTAGVATDEANSDFHRLAEYGQMPLRVVKQTTERARK